MPVRTAGPQDRVKIHIEDDGTIIKVSGKGVSGSNYPAFAVSHDMYGDHGAAYYGNDGVDRTNKYGITRDGYIYDVGTAEAYANALLEMIRQQKRKNIEYHLNNATTNA